MQVTAFLILALIQLINCILAQDCECGVESVSRRIIRGRESKPYTFPWVVYVEESGGFFSKGSSCTGSLISPTFVLTAAHCVPENGNPSNMFVSTYQGCDRWRTRYDFRSKFSVKRIIRHPRYSSVTNGYDIALVELSSPVTGVMPVCLPRRASSSFSNLVVAGWGMLEKGNYDKQDSNCLREADLAIVSDWTCRRTYGVPSDRVLCAGGTTGVCQGDSGGPLMTRSNGRVSQVGVTSFTREDCGIATRSPGGFERVSAHLTWISMNARGVCFK